MFGTRWQIFRLHGIPISIDASWLVILALLTLTMATSFPALMVQFFGPAVPPLTPLEYWLMGLVAALAFFVCIVLHELGHAIVARSRGIPIAGITRFLFGGVAELRDEPESAGSEFAMAIAGPIVSVFLGSAFAVLAWMAYLAGWAPSVVLVLAYLSFINLVVLAFNLVPAFPLDGGRVLRSILWAISGDVQQATHWASRGGQIFAWFLIFWGVMQFFLGNWLGGIWLGLIGLFLNSAARGSYQQVLLRKALEGETVRRFMNRNPITVQPSLDLHHWVNDYVYGFHHKTYPVASNGHVEGVISTAALDHFPKPEWEQHTVGEAMQRDIKDLTVSPDADALQAFTKMQRTRASCLLVIEGDRLVGLLSQSDVLRFLHLKFEIESSESSKWDSQQSRRHAEHNGKLSRGEATLGPAHR
jgi:Zn-dependent protease/CBS domain-containing protein